MELTLRTSRTAPLLTEQVLVAAARQGDDNAFEELYSRYRQRIFAFILNRVHDHGRAEDIAQEVFISALRRLRATNQQISFKPWIYEIAKNACIDEFRRGARSREVALEPDEEAAGRRPLMSVVPTPSDAVENKQRLDDLKGAFGGLSEDHHQLLLLREFEGLSYDEIGERLGMTRQMVESSLFRARRKLTEEYDELASGRRCMQIQTAIESGSAQSITSLGVRERRRIARHLAHCQTCRHTALVAGVDGALLKPKSVAAKIAALFPFPVWRWLGRGGGGRGSAATGSASRHFVGRSLRGAARVAQPASSSVSLGQVTATVAALAIAGAGTGLVIGTGHQHASPPSSATLASAIVSRGQSQSTGSAGTSNWPGAALASSREPRMAGVLRIGSGSALFSASSAYAPMPSPSSASGPRTSPVTSAKPSPLALPAATLASGDPITAATGPTESTLLGKLATTVAGVDQTLHSTVVGVRRGLDSTTTGLKSVVVSTTSGVKNTLSTVTSAVNAPPDSTVAGAAAGTGSAASGTPAGSTGSVSSAGSAAGSTASSAAPSAPQAAAPSGIGNVGSLTGSARSSAASTSTAPSSAAGSSAAASSPTSSGPVASVTGSLKSVISGVLGG